MFVLKTRVFFLIGVVFFTHNILAKAPNWIEASQRNKLFPEDNYIIGFVVSKKKKKKMKKL